MLPAMMDMRVPTGIQARVETEMRVSLGIQDRAGTEKWTPVATPLCESTRPCQTSVPLANRCAPVTQRTPVKPLYLFHTSALPKAIGGPASNSEAGPPMH